MFVVSIYPTLYMYTISLTLILILQLSETSQRLVIKPIHHYKYY